MSETYFADAEAQQHWRRNAVVRALAFAKDMTTVEVAQKLYGREGPEATLKAATLPAATNGWGAATAGQRVGEFLGNLRPRSAAAQLIERGYRADMTGVGSVSLPRLQTTWPAPAFVAEGEPIPVQRGDFTSITLTPKKLASLSAITNELATLSAESAEAIVSESMDEAAARSLDAAIFSTAAATAISPAGILNGVTALAATTGGGVAALAADVGKLTGAIHTAGGGSSIVLFMAPPQAASAQILAGAGLNMPIITAPSLAAGTVVAVEAQAFASGFSDAPRLEVGREAALHFEDVAPQHLSAVGSPNNTVTAPVRSAWQADLVALRLILRVGFVMRAPGMVQHITAASY